MKGFQALIGILRTHHRIPDMKLVRVFQALIGILRTSKRRRRDNRLEKVSSPYRYSANPICIFFYLLARLVSSPYRYSANLDYDAAVSVSSSVSSPYRYSANIAGTGTGTPWNAAFQALIGILRTEKVPQKPWSEALFQALIGILRTVSAGKESHFRIPFKPL